MKMSGFHSNCDSNMLELSEISAPPVTRSTALSGFQKTSLCIPPDLNFDSFPPTIVHSKSGIQKTPIRRERTDFTRKASQFCHICSQKPSKKMGGKAVCSRFREGRCRKMVCEKCLRRHGWDFDAIARNPGSWVCPHCENSCPTRSQCYIYNRVNAKRRVVLELEKQTSFSRCSSN